MTNLTKAFEDLAEKVREGLDLLTKQSFRTFDKLTGISQDDLEGYKYIDEALTTFANYVQEHTEMMEDMSKKLDDIQNELKDLKFDIEEIKETRAD